MLCQQSKLPIGTCKELLKSANLRTYEAFCSWKLDNFGRWSGWFEKPYLWTIGSFEFGFVVCTHSPSLCALKFSLTFWVLSESKKHADDPSTGKSITIIVKDLNCSTLASQVFHNPTISLLLFWWCPSPSLSWTETPKILETNNKIPKNIGRLSNGYDTGG